VQNRALDAAEIAQHIRFHTTFVHALARPAYVSKIGATIYAFFLASFIFYLYVRISRTMHASGGVLAYQVTRGPTSMHSRLTGNHALILH
jgi:hypothetical protein